MHLVGFHYKNKESICAEKEKTYKTSNCSRPVRLGYGLNGQGFKSQNVWKIYLLSRTSKAVLGFTHPPTLRVLEALSPRVKRPRRKVVHSNPSCTEVNNEWNYSSTPPLCTWTTSLFTVTHLTFHCDLTKNVYLIANINVTIPILACFYRIFY